MRKLLALTVVALFTSSSAMAASGGCHTISGTYINRNVPCTVPALACVETEITGDLAGVGTTTITAFDAATQTFSGTTTNTLENGAFTTGTIVGTLIGGVGNSVSTLSDGTRQFAHASGTVVSHSVDGVGTYSGEYCFANSDHD
jgi:hypothetical protein